MASITKQQAQAIRTLTRRANRRIERASGGMRSQLEYYVTRTTGAAKFSAATKGLSYEEAALKLEQLDRFLASPVTTIRGWKEKKKDSVRKANRTLQEEGYDLTDEELADILEQIEEGDSKNFYRAVNLVEAKKAEAGEDWSGSSDQIAAAIAEKATYQQALQKALKVREGRAKS